MREKKSQKKKFWGFHIFRVSNSFQTLDIMFRRKEESCSPENKLLERLPFETIE